MAKKIFEEGKPITITLGPDIRFLWPYVFEKRQNDDGEDKYEVDVQIPYENKKAIDLIDDAIDEAIERGFSGKLRAESTFKLNTKPEALNIPLKDGADKADDEKYGWMHEGYMYMKAKTARKPTVVDRNGQEIIDPANFRMGAKGAVSITLFPYNRKTQGVGVQLNHIMQIEESQFEGGGYVTVEDAFAKFLPQGGAESNRRSIQSRTRPGTPTRRGSEDSDDPMFE